MPLPPSKPLGACPDCGKATHWHGEILHCAYCNWSAVANANATTFGDLSLGEAFVRADRPDLVLIKAAPGGPEIPAAPPVLQPGHQINAYEADDPQTPWVVTDGYPVIRARDRRIAGLFSYS